MQCQLIVFSELLYIISLDVKITFSLFLSLSHPPVHNQIYSIEFLHISIPQIFSTRKFLYILHIIIINSLFDIGQFAHLTNMKEFRSRQLGVLAPCGHIDSGPHILPSTSRGSGLITQISQIYHDDPCPNPSQFNG